MADEYVKRETVYDTLTEYYHHRTDTQHGALREALSRVPAADVRPVVRGRWKGEGLGDYRCSVCDDITSGKPNFCPNCGAKMEVEHERTDNKAD